MHNREEVFRTLEATLDNLGIRTQRAHTCSEARAALQDLGPSPLTPTATTLADGTWADVRNLASMHGRAIPVIVVSRVVDIDLGHGERKRSVTEGSARASRILRLLGINGHDPDTRKADHKTA